MKGVLEVLIPLGNVLSDVDDPGQMVLDIVPLYRLVDGGDIDTLDKDNELGDTLSALVRTTTTLSALYEAKEDKRPHVVALLKAVVSNGGSKL